MKITIKIKIIVSITISITVTITIILVYDVTLHVFDSHWEFYSLKLKDLSCGIKRD